MEYILVQERDAQRMVELISSACREKGFTRIEIVSVQPKQEYNPERIEIYCRSVKGGCYVSTSLEGGWPFLHYLIESRKLCAVCVRYTSNEIAELFFWQKGQRNRVIRALRDTRWTWFTEGDPLPFEDVSFYSRPRVKDRLPADLLNSYLIDSGFEETLERVGTFYDEVHDPQISDPEESAPPMVKSETSKRNLLLNVICDQPEHIEGRALVTVSEFFDGNVDLGSIGCNLPDHPGLQEFRRILCEIGEREDVSNVWIQIYDLEDGDWPFAENVLIVGAIAGDQVEQITAKLGPTEVFENVIDWCPSRSPGLHGKRCVHLWWD